MGNDDRLKKMRERMGKAQERNRGGGGFWNIPKSGSKNFIRILPAVGRMDPGIFWQTEGQHWQNRKPVAVCPKITTEETAHLEECPICAFATEQWNGGDKELAKSWFASRRYRINIIVRSDNEAGYEGPYIWTLGNKIFDDLFKLVESDQYGDISDVNSGFDLEVYARTENDRPKYYVVASRYESPLLGKKDHPNQAAIEELLAQATDLTDLLDQLPSYDDLNELIQADLSDEGESMFDEDLEEIDF